MWEGWRRKNDTEIYSSSSAQTQCTHLHAILGYTIEYLSYYINSCKKKSDEKENIQSLKIVCPVKGFLKYATFLTADY